MPDTKLLSNLTLNVNNMAVSYVVGSIKYKEGLGTRKVNVAAAGGNSVDFLVGDDLSEHKSAVSFELHSTSTNVAYARTWKNNGSANVIKLTNNDNFTKTFTKMTLVNDPEIELSADGKIKLEFEGATAA